jgi:DNA-binding response OmpR family regulator
MDETVNKKKILIVDDETSLALLYKLRLEIEGFEVVYCDNGETAIQTAREYRPDLILLDLMMPRLSGFDAIDLLRNTLETSETLIIVLSALSQPDDIAKAKDMGADDYIVKSDTSIDEVVVRIKAVIYRVSQDYVPAAKDGV